MEKISLPYFFLLVCIVFAACSKQPENNQKTNTSDIEASILTIIGEEDQPFEHQLGEPMSVFTDESGHIFIADQASLTIKVFDDTGSYLRSFGGRGRGPEEFQQFNLVGKVYEDTLLVQDRGKLAFIYITSKGEFLSSHPVDISYMPNQYYPEILQWYSDYSLGLYQKASFPRYDPPPMDRPLFYIYDHSFGERKASFFPFRELGFSEDNMFVWSSFVPFPGSFDLHSSGKKMIYSPGVYTGKLYEFTRSDSLQWNLSNIHNGLSTVQPTYEVYQSEEEYQSKMDIPGVNQIHFSGGPYWGRLYSLDAGVFYLNNGHIVQFYGEWNDGEKTLDEGNELDIYAQIINEEGKLINHGYLMSVKRDFRPSLPLVNWKDEQDNFYLINLPRDDVPTVVKFRLVKGE